MNEVEVKAKVGDVAKVTTRLLKLGCKFSDPIVQHDFVYTRKGVDPTAAKTTGNPVLRIRDEGKKILFTLKQDRENELDCVEKEIEVNDKSILADILDMLGFEKIVEINKTRRKAKYKDYEICLDDVANLGSFIEVETFSDEPGKKIQSELFNFLKTLGISEKDRVLRGYDTLIYEKNRGDKIR